MADNVNHPSHYNQGGVECIDSIKAATINKPPFEAVCVANIIKYLWRYEEKGGIEDVEKAGWYLTRLHEELADKSNKYQLVGTPNGVGFSTPWKTIIIPNDGDMLNPKRAAVESLLNSLRDRGGFCPCRPQQNEDTLCPCKFYREDGKCICGLFVKIPQVVKDNVKNEVVGDDPKTTDGEKL